MATVKWSVSAIAITACFAAFGRDEQGRLDQVLLPHEAQPAIAAPGDLLRITARGVGTVSLESADGRIELTAKWRGIESGLALAEAVLPKELTLGRYDVVWQEGGVSDRNVSAVRIVSDSEGPYTLRVIQEPESIETIISEADNDIDGVLVWGGLESLTEKEQLRLLEHIRTADHDVFVAPRETPLNRAIWGTAPVRLSLGVDSVLVFSFNPQSGMNGPIAEERVYRLRRESAANRWSVGISHEPPGRKGIRNALTSLADEPLAYLALPLPQAEPRTPRAFPAPRIGSLPTPRQAGEFIDWVFEAGGVSARYPKDAP